MLKMVPIAAAVAVLAVSTTANPPIRYMDFEAAGAGVALELDVKGVALVSTFETGWSRMSLTVQGLAPNTLYHVDVGDQAFVPCAFLTNSRGSGGFAGEIPGIVSQAAALRFFVRDAPCNDPLHPSWDKAFCDETELHAVGAPVMN